MLRVATRVFPAAAKRGAPRHAKGRRSKGFFGQRIEAARPRSSTTDRLVLPRANRRHLRERGAIPGAVGRNEAWTSSKPRSKPRSVAMIEQSFAKGGD